ncbi:ABC transporter substrate-binding protein [Streptosporangium amethystogenes subsp. fukuiense]|uniref:ABC transporter substrate-binding protein n=1 Tax=Streptosporangium amethystogenes subsp. fukuiense TaxID=698418 RepID=A0ABW2SWI5_9ACTN
MSVITSRAAGLLGVTALGLGLLTACGGSDSSTAADGAPSYGECKVSGAYGSHKLTTVDSGVLTIQAALPAPGDYNGDTPQDVKSGYSYCLAAEIAHRAGIPRLELKNVSFDALVSGRTKDYDLTIYQLYKTPEREKVADFTDPYLNVKSGVLVRSDSTLDATTIKDAKIGILLGSVQDRFVNEQLKPAQQAKQYQSINDMITALRARQIDAVILDTTLVMLNAQQIGDAVKVIGQYPIGGDAAIMLPKGSANTAGVSAIVGEMKADGTLDRVFKEQFESFLGGDPDDLPEWSVS